MKTDFESAYGAKLRQCNKEALVTLVALAATVVVWAVCGFGLAGIDFTVAGVPLWVVGGCVGTWIFAIFVSVVLAKWIFADFDVDDEPAESAPVASNDVATSATANEGGER